MAAICSVCNMPIPSGEAKKYKSKPFHEECLTRYKLSLKQEALKKDRTKARTLVKDIDEQKCISIICSALQVNNPPPLLMKQLARLHEEFSFPYSGLEKALKYYYYILPEEKRNTETLGLIPYIYREAQAFWSSVEEANRYNENKFPEEKNRIIHYQSKPSSLSLSYKMEDL